MSRDVHILCVVNIIRQTSHKFMFFSACSCLVTKLCLTLQHARLPCPSLSQLERTYFWVRHFNSAFNPLILVKCR